MECFETGQSAASQGRPCVWQLTEHVAHKGRHGMTKSEFVNDDMAHNSDGVANPWYNEMPVLGYNYRLTDIQSALGLSQLERLDWSLERRNKIAFE